MRWMKLALLSVCFFVGVSFNPSGYRDVRYVYDGDTILIDRGEKVRYRVVNSP
jgi:hypothetical protein